MYDIVIIGGGPAGAAAAVYAARKKLKTLLLTESFGGQSVVSSDIRNWIGEKNISGFDLAKKLEEHVRSFSDAVEVKMSEKAVKVSRLSPGFEIESDKGAKYQTKTVILAAGARRRRLGIPGEDKFEGMGVSFCSTCDAPLFSDKRVAVIGGGNAGLEAAQDLFLYASEVYIVHRGETLKGDPSTQEEIKKNPKLKEIILNSQPTEILGDKMVTGLKYRNLKTNEEKEFKLDGIFVEVGSVPNSEMVKGLVEMDEWGQVKIDSKHSTTSVPGIFAAGDITDDPYKQNNISAGDAVKAALAAYNYLLNRKK